jgi:hypothetical protein
MERDRISQVRGFNRTVTERVGMNRPGFRPMPRS